MDTEKKVSRGLHGISIGSIVAAIAILLSNPEKAESVLWYINHKTEVHQNINVVPQLQSLVFDLRIRMDRLEEKHEHESDSLSDLINDLQRATRVLAVGKRPYDSVRVTLNSGQEKSFHVNTSWIWRARE